MLPDQRVLALRDERLARLVVEVALDAVLLLAEALLGLLEVVGDGVLREEGVGLGLVVLFRVGEEGGLEVVAVDVKADFGDVGLVETEGDEGVDDLFDEALVDDFAVTVLFD